MVEHDALSRTQDWPHLFSRGLLFAVTLAVAPLIAACANGTTQTTNHNTNQNHNANHGDAGDAQGLGTNCNFSWECSSLLCLVVGPENICAKPCATDPCPEGFYCAHVDVLAAPVGEPTPASGFYCLPDRGGLCKSCGSDINCAFAGDRCLDLGGGEKVCGRDCTFDGTCPIGYECKQQQCFPVGNTCDCTADRVGVSEACQNMNEFGVCTGSRTCQADGWTECDARTPSFEVCNGEDDNCDGQLPEDEKDSDGNGTIDCMENCTPSPEECNSQDDDCNGAVDDGDPEAMCGTAAHGVAACELGLCVVASCDPGWVDINEDLTDGCECQLTTSGGDTCDQAEAVGPLSDAAPGSTETRTGILRDNEERWYAVDVVDEPEVSPGGCDAFHFRVQLNQNPAAVYQFDVIGPSCTDDALCPSAVTDFQFFTNYRTGTAPDFTGECPCSTDPVDGENECQDETATYYIRLFRNPGAPLTCEPFELEFTNGVYPSPI